MVGITAENRGLHHRLLGLGSAYGFLRKSAEAQAALRKAVRLDPKNSYARAQLGTALGRSEQYAAAIVELKEAVRLKPDLADARFALGLAYLSSGNSAAANVECDALARFDPASARRLRSLIAEGKE